ncbi:MAG: NAD-dependent epimerase/dehydratase family protein [Burkholderiaceae bacterium]|jgi:UDP-glucose 4-epimerase
MSRHLVLGGCGFIGRHLALALAQQGEHVAVADIVPPPAALAEIIPAFHTVSPEFSDWSSLLDAYDVIHHCAWSTIPRTANENPLKDIDDNLKGLVRLLEAMRPFPGKRLVFASSGGTVYGRLRQIPVPEDHPLAPITAYGASKVSAETYLGFYRGCYGIDCRVARISNPFGAGQNPRGGQGAVSTFLFQALQNEEITIWGDGSVVRDYIHIADLVAGLVRLSEVSFPDNETLPVFNIGSGHGVSLNAIIDTLRTRLQLHPQVTYLPGRAFDVPVSVLDITKAESVLGWHPRLSLEEGCARMLSDIRSGQALFSNLLS